MDTQSHAHEALGAPEDLMGAAVFLASEASAFMTGQVMVIDGGMTVAI